MTTTKITRRSMMVALSTVTTGALAMDIENYIRLGLDKSHFDDPEKAMDMVINGRSNAEHFQSDL